MAKQYKGMGPVDVAIKRALIEGLEEIGADLTGEAQRRAPKDEGTLRASAHWELEDESSLRGGFGMSAGPAEGKVRVSFEVPYAKPQHEREDYHHTLGQAKYLEEPANEKALGYGSTISTKIKQQLGRAL